MKKALQGLLAAAVAAVLVWVLVRSSQPPPRPGERGVSAFDYTPAEPEAAEPAVVIGREVRLLPVALEEPRGLAAGPNGTVCVVGDSNLVVVAEDGAELRRVAFEDAPACVAVADDGGMVVGFRKRLLLLDGAGSSGDGAWPVLGDRAFITSVAAWGGSVVLADAGRRVVEWYDRNGVLQVRIGGASDGEKEPLFVVPSPYFDLARGVDDTLWVVDPGRHALRNYRMDGTLRGSWAATGGGAEGFGGCCNPTHIAIRSDGTFVASEKGIVRVKLYDEVGGLVGVVAGAEAFDAGTTGLDLAVDARDRILVLDRVRRSVRIFAIEE